MCLHQAVLTNWTAMWKPVREDSRSPWRRTRSFGKWWETITVVLVLCGTEAMRKPTVEENSDQGWTRKFFGLMRPKFSFLPVRQDVVFGGHRSLHFTSNILPIVKLVGLQWQKVKLMQQKMGKSCRTISVHLQENCGFRERLSSRRTTTRSIWLQLRRNGLKTTGVDETRCGLVKAQTSFPWRICGWTWKGWETLNSLAVKLHCLLTVAKGESTEWKTVLCNHFFYVTDF